MSSFAEDLIALYSQLERRVVDLERAPRSTIRDGALTILDADGNPIVVLGKQSDGLYNLSVFDDSGVRQSRVGQLADGGYGIEDINGAGDTVTLEQLAFGLVAAAVAANESTSSSSYTDLATPGPAVTVNIGSSGRALVQLSCKVPLSVDAGQQRLAAMGFAVSGASTLAADDTRAATTFLTQSNPGTSQSTVGITPTLSRTLLVTGLDPGANTFTAKYSTNGVSLSFSNRLIGVQPF